MNVMFFAVQMFSIVWGIISFLVPQNNINPHGATIYDPSHPNVSSFLYVHRVIVMSRSDEP